MSGVVRFGVSLDARLLERFDRWKRRKRYPNRSEAIRDLIRERLVEHDAQAGRAEVVGSLSLVYDHEAMDLAQKLTRLEHRYIDTIVSSLHVHLDHHNCLEVVILRGRADHVQKIGDELIATRGVKHGKLSVTTTGKGLG